MVSRKWMWATIVLAVLLVFGMTIGTMFSVSSGSGGVGDIRPTTSTTG